MINALSPSLYQGEEGETVRRFISMMQSHFSGLEESIRLLSHFGNGLSRFISAKGGDVDESI